MKAKDKAGFTVDDEPNVMLYSIDFYDSFVCVPLVGVEVHGGNELYSYVIE